jgi:hypothetical protein
MWALFGVGMHPLATQRLQQLADEQLSDENIRAATRLGAPFKLRDVEPNRFQVEVARRFADQARSTKALASQRDIRAEAARQFFQAEHGRVPTDERELSAAIAKLSRPPAQPVAGYDLTFSPVKSVSALWAVADPQIAAVIERAHQAAVGDALSFIENHVLYAREGPHGVRQVNVRGLVAAAFTHRTAARVIQICTPTSRSPTRSKPCKAVGCRLTGGCCSRPSWPRGDLQHRPGTSLA